MQVVEYLPEPKLRNCLPYRHTAPSIAQATVCFSSAEKTDLMSPIAQASQVNKHSNGWTVLIFPFFFSEEENLLMLRLIS